MGRMPVPGATIAAPSRFMRAVDAVEYVAANYFPCTISFLKRETERGTLPHYMIQGVRHYTAEDISQWVRGMRRVGTKGGAA